MNEATEDLLEAPAPRAVTTADLRGLLRRKFPADAYAMLHEVRDGAGHQARRSADVFVIGLWPSRGCQVEGMELKVSRSDWLRELKKPEKADAFVKYCDRWWIVTTDEKIVHRDELPPNWGLMVARGRGVGVVVDAPLLKPEPVDRSLLAAMLKRATQTAIDSPEIEAHVSAKIKSAVEAHKVNESYLIAGAKRELEQLRKALADFEAASGVQIDAWQAGNIGRAVRMVLLGEHSYQMKRFESLRNQARDLVQWFDAHQPPESEPTPGS